MPDVPPKSDLRDAARFHRGGQLREAAALYRRILQRDPHDAQALRALGVMAHQTGRADAAEKLLLRAVIAAPSLPEAHIDLGSLWMIQGHLERALSAFSEALRLAPGHPMAHACRAAALAKSGKTQSAVAEYQRAVDSATAGRASLRVRVDASAATRTLLTLTESEAPGYPSTGRAVAGEAGHVALTPDGPAPAVATRSLPQGVDVAAPHATWAEPVATFAPAMVDPALTPSAPGWAPPESAVPAALTGPPAFPSPAEHLAEHLADPAEAGALPAYAATPLFGESTVLGDPAMSDRMSDAGRPPFPGLDDEGESLAVGMTVVPPSSHPGAGPVSVASGGERSHNPPADPGGRPHTDEPYPFVGTGRPTAPSPRPLPLPGGLQTLPGDSVFGLAAVQPQPADDLPAVDFSPNGPSVPPLPSQDEFVLHPGFSDESVPRSALLPDLPDVLSAGGDLVANSGFTRLATGMTPVVPGSAPEDRDDWSGEIWPQDLDISLSPLRIDVDEVIVPLVEPELGDPGTDAAHAALRRGGAPRHGASHLGAVAGVSEPAAPMSADESSALADPFAISLGLGDPAEIDGSTAAAGSFEAEPAGADGAASHLGAGSTGDAEPLIDTSSVPSFTPTRPPLARRRSGIAGDSTDGETPGAADLPEDETAALSEGLDEAGQDDVLQSTRLLAKQLRRARRGSNADGQMAVELQREGATHLRQRRLEEAIDALRQLVVLHPASAKAHRDLGAAYLRADRLDDAIVSLLRALELRPRFADAYASLGDAYHLQGRIDDAIACYRHTLSLRPTAAAAHSNLLLTLNYHRKVDRQDLFNEHLRWARLHATPFGENAPPPDNDATIGRTLRIGYVSADFRRHAVSAFMEPLLESRDRSAIHVTCYSDVARPDEVTERLAASADRWRDCRGMNDDELARLIRDDRIDILVDLAGHTGANRLAVFARKPAPVQVTYLGYPNTTGMSAMHYRITDGWADPIGQSEEFHTEELARVAQGFLCYRPPNDAPEVGPLPARTQGAITFGCFNILAKVSPDTIAVWAKIMSFLPDSRLVMKDRLGALRYPARRQQVLDLFAHYRIDSERLDLLPKEPDPRQHLATYDRVDMVLDPFPYNGTTTTCEALWMGVPVISLAGNRHAARVGVSVLNAAGLPELVANNIESYVRIAVGLGRDLNRLALLRRTLRQRLSASALLDSRRFCGSIESLYRQMWERWCRQQAAGTGNAHARAS